MAAHRAPSLTPALDKLYADLDLLLDYPLYLANEDTYEAANEVTRFIIQLIPRLRLPVPQQNVLTELILATYDERKAIRAEAADVFRAVQACREQIIVAKKEQEQIKDSMGGQAAVSSGETEQKADQVAGVDINGRETTWLRLL